MVFLFPGMKKAAEAGVTTEGIISNERPYLDATEPDTGMKIEQWKDVSERNYYHEVAMLCTVTFCFLTVF